MAERLNRIMFRTTAVEELESLPRPVQELVAAVIDLLRVTDLPKGAIQMRERPDLRRIDVGRRHRLIYGVPRVGEIEVLRIRSRAAAYVDPDDLQ